MAVTANERKRQERERKRAAGLIKVEIWLMPDQAKNVRDYAKGLQRNDLNIQIGAERIAALEDDLREAVSIIKAIQNSDLEFGLPDVDGVNWWYAVGEFQANRIKLLGE